MFLSENGELYSCGLDNLEFPPDVILTEKLYPEKVSEQTLTKYIYSYRMILIFEFVDIRIQRSNCN